MALYSYSAKSVAVIVGGARLTGLGPDEFLTIEVNDDDWSETEGADGHVVRSLMPNTLANGTITLQQSSPFNEVFTSMRNRDTGRATGEGFTVSSGVVNFEVKDLLSGEKLSASKMYIKKMSPRPYAKSAGTREWTFTLVDPIFSVSKANTVVQQILDQVFGAIDLTNSITG